MLYRLIVLLAFCIAQFSLSAQSKTDTYLSEILHKSNHPILQQVIKDPMKYRCQIIYTEINRDKKKVFEGSIAISQIKRKFDELVSFVYRECSFPNGCLIMTGTGIVPGSDFTLKSGDEINISIDNIGTLSNTVQ